MTDPSPSTLTLGARIRHDLRAVLKQFGPKTDLGRQRRAALPGWITFFSWVFFLLPVGLPAALIASVLYGAPINLGIFGMHYSGSFNLQALLLAIVIGACAVTARGLLWGRSWGLFASVITGWGGLVLCFVAPFVDDRPGLHLPLEPLLLIPFLISLSGLKAKWREEAGD